MDCSLVSIDLLRFILVLDLPNSSTILMFLRRSAWDQITFRCLSYRLQLSAETGLMQSNAIRVRRLLLVLSLIEVVLRVGEERIVRATLLNGFSHSLPIIELDRGCQSISRPSNRVTEDISTRISDQCPTSIFCENSPAAHCTGRHGDQILSCLSSILIPVGHFPVLVSGNGNVAIYLTMVLTKSSNAW